MTKRNFLKLVIVTTVTNYAGNFNTYKLKFLKFALMRRHNRSKIPDYKIS